MVGPKMLTYLGVMFVLFLSSPPVFKKKSLRKCFQSTRLHVFLLFTSDCFYIFCQVKSVSYIKFSEITWVIKINSIPLQILSSCRLR